MFMVVMEIQIVIMFMVVMKIQKFFRMFVIVMVISRFFGKIGAVVEIYILLNCSWLASTFYFL
jgi:hypothetical protein